jgi:hypothetical protein
MGAFLSSGVYPYGARAAPHAQPAKPPRYIEPLKPPPYETADNADAENEWVTNCVHVLRQAANVKPNEERLDAESEGTEADNGFVGAESEVNLHEVLRRNHTDFIDEDGVRR